ncbi:MAG: type II toxin-antitoxin system HipA family toxin [Chloroflexota bacterium]
MEGARDSVVVHLDAPELGSRRAVGTLARERSEAKSVFSFAYEAGWIETAAAFPLDPALPLFEGDQYASALPGAFADAAPDRWGRTLLERREALRARRAEGPPRRFDDWDFLLAVDDRTRMGALRLARSDHRDYVAADALPIPPVARLRELEHWARELEEGLSDEMSEEDRWVAMLVAPGSSLGGARPKASFADGDDLWIAKFPSSEDRHDVGAWEYVLSGLAEGAGIEVPEAKLMPLGSTYRTYCAKRFDRMGAERRLYASAMTLAGRRDNEDASYLDIVRAIVERGDADAIAIDLEQLFRRLVFNLLTGNRDDHLRNHGFLRTAGGWRLAPAFDVNPSMTRQEHSLAIDGTVRIPDLDLARDTARHYRLSAARAQQLIGEVSDAVGRWPELARQVGLPRDEIARVGIAFASA